MKIGSWLRLLVATSAAAVLLLSGVTITRSGPPTEVQELAPGLTVGSKIRDDSGRIWTVQSTHQGPPGFYLCPNDQPAVHPTLLDLKTALRCRDGAPFDPDERVQNGNTGTCTAGAVIFLCDTSGQKIEQLLPSKNEIKAGTSTDPNIIMPEVQGKTTRPAPHWWPLIPPWASPTSWHLGQSTAYAIGGGGGVASIGGNTVYFTVVERGHYNNGEAYAVIYYASPTLGDGYTTVTSS